LFVLIGERDCSHFYAAANDFFRASSSHAAQAIESSREQTFVTLETYLTR
jgi:hypothetical protein